MAPIKSAEKLRCLKRRKGNTAAGWASGNGIRRGAGFVKSFWRPVGSSALFAYRTMHLISSETHGWQAQLHLTPGFHVRSNRQPVPLRVQSTPRVLTGETGKRQVPVP